MNESMKRCLFYTVPIILSDVLLLYVAFPGAGGMGAGASTGGGAGSAPPIDPNTPQLKQLAEMFVSHFLQMLATG